MKALLTTVGMMLAVGLAIASFGESAWAQGPQQPYANGATAAAMPPGEVDRIIGTMLQKESENASARAGYAFKRDADLRTIGLGGHVNGDLHRVSEFDLDARGARVEKVVYFPQSTIVELSPQAIDSIRAIDDFSLNTTNIGSYYVQFAGRSKLDELGVFAFDVTPKAADDRTFAGRIWVDDRDLRIVKIQGTFGALAANTHGPVFDIYREEIDGRYWFPTYIHVDGLLQTGRETVHIQLTTRLTNYRHVTAPPPAPTRPPLAIVVGIDQTILPAERLRMNDFIYAMLRERENRVSIAGIEEEVYTRLSFTNDTRLLYEANQVMPYGTDGQRARLFFASVASFCYELRQFGPNIRHVIVIVANVNYPRVILNPRQPIDRSVSEAIQAARNTQTTVFVISLKSGSHTAQPPDELIDGELRELASDTGGTAIMATDQTALQTAYANIEQILNSR